MTMESVDGGAGQRVERHELVRRHNQRVVLETFLRAGELTRVEIADRTALSKPTVNTIVEELEGLGLVQRMGIRGGSVGRSAAVYRPDPRAGAVVAVDIGARRVRAAVADLLGDVVVSRTIDTPARGGVVEGVVGLVRELLSAAEVRPGIHCVAAVGSPGVVDPVTGQLSYALNIPELIGLNLGEILSRRLNMPVVVENDVNLAAVGEARHGGARGIDDFAFLWVGNGIGLGAVVGGDLLRGSRGAAGEVGFLPIGEDALSGARGHGTLETAAGAAGIRAAARSLRPTVPHTSLGSRPSVEQVFAAAVDGDPLGLAVVDREARLLAQAVVAVCAMLDPALVLLGGGVGANEVLVGPVESYLRRLSPLRVPVRASELREQASLWGALSLGIDALRRIVVDEGRVVS